MAERYGLWPGVVALSADADLYCVPCAQTLYGTTPIQAVVDGTAGYEQYTDHEGNPFGVLLYGSEDLHGEFCGNCHERLCEEDCPCANPRQAAHWLQFSEFLPG